MECSFSSVRVRFVDGVVGVSDARLFHSRSVAYKCYWLARDVFGYGEESARECVYGWVGVMVLGMRPRRRSLITLRWAARCDSC